MGVKLYAGDEGYANEQNKPGWQRRYESDDCLPPGDGFPRSLLNSQFPGTHAQGLTTMRPEPAKKNKTDQNDISRNQWVAGLKLVAT